MARERAIANQLAKLLGASELPIYAVDDRRRVVFCNPACATWLEVAVEELVGQQCNYDSADSGDRVQDLASRLCPPPDIFAGDHLTGHFKICDKDSTEPRTAECFSFPDTDGDNAGVFVVVRSVGDQAARLDKRATYWSPDELHTRLQQIVRSHRSSYRLEHLVGDSLPIQRVREQVKVAMETVANVQIVGPVGSGREHVARTIHACAQPEQAGPLMPLSCNLLDGELLQATVVAFLHRATEADPAHPATLLLLDADLLNAEAQAEMQAFFRVPTFGLRTIATVQTPLTQLADENTFLRELAFRLSPTTIELPSLSDRREDLPLLCQKFVETFNARGEKQLSGFAPAAMERLCSLPWSGEVEELAEVVQESCNQADGPMVTESDLARRVKLVASAIQNPVVETETITLDDFLQDIERELLGRALQTAKGNKAEAARLLGISRARVIRRAGQLGLD